MPRNPGGFVRRRADALRRSDVLKRGNRQSRIAFRIATGWLARSFGHPEKFALVDVGPATDQTAIPAYLAALEHQLDACRISGNPDRIVWGGRPITGEEACSRESWDLNSPRVKSASE